MNRTTLAGLLVALAGSIVGGVTIVQGVLEPGAELIVECAPEGDCVMAARPAAEQCPTLLEGGGDRPGEATGLEGDQAKAARILVALLEGGAINGFRTVAADSGCVVAVALSRQQAAEWRQALTGQDAGGNVGGEVLATLTPTSPAGLQVQWAGSSAPEERTEAFNLLAVDAGPGAP
jgi:hypothetical protein